MGAEASSNLMTFSTHLLALEPDYDNKKYKASPSPASSMARVSEEPEHNDSYHINSTLRYLYL